MLGGWVVRVRHSGWGWSVGSGARVLGHRCAVGICVCLHACVHVCVPAHACSSMCTCVCVCVPVWVLLSHLVLLRGPDSCKPHGLVSSRLCMAKAAGTVTWAGSDLWLPLLAPLAAGCRRDVNEGRTSGPGGSCGVKPSAGAAGKACPTQGSWGPVSGSPLARERLAKEPAPTHSVSSCVGPGLSFPSWKSRRGHPLCRGVGCIHAAIRASVG